MSKVDTLSIAPRLPMPAPAPGEPFANQRRADRDVAGSDERQRAPVAIAALPIEPDRAGRQQLREAAPGAQGQCALGSAFPGQFGRVDIGDPDLLAIEPEGVAIVDASGAGTVKRTQCKSESGQYGASS